MVNEAQIMPHSIRLRGTSGVPHAYMRKEVHRTEYGHQHARFDV